MLFKRKRLFSSFVPPDLKNQKNKNKTSLKNGTKFIGMYIYFFGTKIINTSSIEESHQLNIRATDDTHKKGTTLYNHKKT